MHASPPSPRWLRKMQLERVPMCTFKGKKKHVFVQSGWRRRARAEHRWHKHRRSPIKLNIKINAGEQQYYSLFQQVFAYYFYNFLWFLPVACQRLDTTACHHVLPLTDVPSIFPRPAKGGNVMLVKTGACLWTYFNSVPVKMQNNNSRHPM